MYQFSRAIARFRSVGLVLTLVLGVQPSAQAVEVQDSEIFVEVLGADTTAIDAFTRTAERWEGRLLLRAPVTQIGTYRAELAPDGTIRRFEVSWETPNANPMGPAPRRITFDLSGDSAVVETNDSTGHTINRYSVPKGTIPTLDKIPWSVGVFQQALHQARAAGGDSVPVWFLGSRTQGAYPNAIVRSSADTVALDFFGSPYLAQINDAGEILAVNGERTTVKYISRRVAPLDFDALAAEFARRDATGSGLGAMSPRDEVRVSVNGVALTVDYGRPSKRGREIFGGLVPWNSVWRTGANAATHFSTDRDLWFGELVVPAGTYTLWTTFTPDSAYLIINSQTQIWGTQYDSAHDFARIPLERATPDMPVERFTISIDEADEGGVLSFAWGEARYRAAFSVQDQ